MEKRILIVDDYEPNRKMHAFVIRNLNQFKRYSTDFAQDGSEAIELIKKKDYSAIISDFHMLTVNGNEIYDWLSNNKPEQTRKFILVAYLEEREYDGFVRAKSIRFVEKDNHMVEKLVKNLEDVLRGQ